MTTSPVVSVTDELVAELGALAEAATQGNWVAEGDDLFFNEDGYTKHLMETSEGTDICHDAEHPANLSFIAAASPATILALLSERAELKRDAARYRWLQKASPYMHKKIRDLAITDGGDVFYFHKDKYDAAIDAAMQSEAKP